MPKQHEQRVLATVRLESRAEGERRTLAGYAALFETPTMIGEKPWGFSERIAPGAFSKTLARGDDVRALWNHDPNHVLARSKSGTLKLSEDDKGLAFEFTPPDTQVGRDLVVLVERGDVSQMSFSFRVVSEKWTNTEDVDERTLIEVDLFDVSPVTFPAYQATEISLRSAASILEGRKQAAVEAQLGEMRLRLLEIDAI